MKITPAHDPNDYDVWQRHQEIGLINILNPDGTLNDNAGPYKGLTIAKARDRVVADLEELGLVGDIEDREIELAHSDRSKTPIEPYLADQWFVKMGDFDDGRRGLAQMAIEPVFTASRSTLVGRWPMDAVTNGCVKIVPRATPRAISTGSARNATGPSAGSSGGDIRFRSGTSRMMTQDESLPNRLKLQELSERNPGVITSQIGTSLLPRQR